MQRIIYTLLIIFSAMITGWALAQGKRKTLLGMMFLFCGVPFINYLSGLSERHRFYVFITAVILISIQMPGILPYGISISELLLIILAIINLFRLPINTEKYRDYGTFACILFASAAGLSAISYDELTEWQIIAVTPLLLMYLSEKIIHSQRDAFLLLQTAVFAILGYVAMYYLAQSIGQVIHPYSAELQWRAGAWIAKLGPIEFHSYSIGFGAFLGFGIPFCFYKAFLRGTGKVSAVLYMTILLVFILLLGLSSARAATIGTIVGICSMILFIRFRSVWILLVSLFLVIGLSFDWGHYFPRIPGIADSFARWESTNWRNLMMDGNFSSRVNFIKIAFEGVLQRPWGQGFSYLDRIGLINDSGFAYLINGTGIMGFICFVTIIVLLTVRFAKALFRGNTIFQRDLAAIGLATLICSMFSTFASSNIFSLQVQSAIFWTIMTAAYRGVTKENYV